MPDQDQPDTPLNPILPSVQDELAPPKSRSQSDARIARSSTNKIVPGRRKTVTDLKKSAREKINRVKRQKAVIAVQAKKINNRLSAVTNSARQLDKALKREIGPIITTDIVEAITPTAVEFIEDTEVTFKPNPGPQTEFLAASEDEVLYGGARGGGKSYSMLVDPLRYCGNKSHRSLLIRRTMPELRDLIYQSKQLYPKAYPGAKFKEQEKEWVFPSGARHEFGYAESLDDAMRYQGQPYTWIGVDELGQFPTSEIWDLLRGSLRSVDPDVPTYMRATANPGGPGQVWIKKMFIDPSPPNQAFKVHISTHLGERHFTRRFIPAKLVDNPYLLQTEQYLIMLSSLPEHKRRQWLEGDWDVTEGAAFPEFDRQYHVCEPFDLPRNWPRFRACDWGYTQPACILWLASDYNNDIFVYRELYVKGMTADKVARKILELEAQDPKPMRGVMDSSVWAKRGDTGPTIPETMQKMGVQFRPSDRSPGSRKAGKFEVHRRLNVEKYNDRDGNPRYRTHIKIFRNCVNLIATLPLLPLDKTDLEDVDTDADDHAYDALRYGLMSRPLNPANKMGDWAARLMNSDTRRVADSKFGY